MSSFQNCLCLLILVVIRCKDLEGVNFPNLKVLKLFQKWQLLGFGCAHYLSEDIVVRGIDGVALLEAIDLCSIDRFISVYIATRKLGGAQDADVIKSMPGCDSA